MTRCFKYDNLPTDNHIRIFELEPGVGEEQVVGRLCLFNLQDELRYEAISYVWGDPTFKAGIICNGKSLDITQNLNDAFRHVRYKDRKRYLWADAVCINQTNLEERGKQVAKMYQIYAKAKTVLACIGSEDEHTEAALSLIKQIVDQSCALSSCSAHELFNQGTRIHGPDLESLPQLKSEVWTSIGKFYCREYFSRLWVIQELGSCESVRVICGRFQVEWYIIGLAASWICVNHPRRGSLLMRILQGLPSPRNQGYFHASWMGRKGLFDNSDRLLTLLQLAREFDASDPKDKVYGLLGFSVFRERPHSLVPDYRKSLKEVYCETARLAIASTMDLSVLYFVIHGGCIDDDFPSWVPRWDYQRKVWGPRMNWCSSRGYGLSISTHGLSDILRLKGLVFDTVITVTRNHLPGAALGFGSYGKDKLDGTELPIQSWTELFTTLKTYPTGESLAAAWSFTLTCSQNAWSKAIDPQPSLGAALHRKNCAAFVVQNARKANTETLFGLDCSDAHGNGSIMQEEAKGGNSDHYHEAALGGVLAVPFFVTNRGYFGLGSEPIQPGDICCVLFGADVPYILRPKHDYYQLVGHCYLHGLMAGEGIDMWKAEELEETELEIH